MHNLNDLNRFRFRKAELARWGEHGSAKMGIFIIPNDPVLRVIADTGEGWDHVSVSTEFRTPTWEEMDKIKRLFFKDHEVVVQFHVGTSDHINIHPHCLHLWRPRFKKIPLPNKDRV